MLDAMSRRALVMLVVLGACTHGAAPASSTAGSGDGLDHARFASTGSTGPIAPMVRPKPPAWLERREAGDTGVVVYVPPELGKLDKTTLDDGSIELRGTAVHDDKTFGVVVTRFAAPLGDDVFLYDEVYNRLEALKLELGVVNYWGYQSGLTLFDNAITYGARDHYVLTDTELDVAAWISRQHLVILTIRGMYTDQRVLADYFDHVEVP